MKTDRHFKIGNLNLLWKLLYYSAFLFYIRPFYFGNSFDTSYLLGNLHCKSTQKSPCKILHMISYNMIFTA